ncbi:MAG TPA: agmatinase [Firmicutes bacterium]|nr:agmatinase [Bacillota bacterium]
MIDLTPWGDMSTENMEEANICVLGVPFDGAVSCGKGTALAPERIRMLSRYLPPITETGIILDNVKVYDQGDVAISLDWEKYYHEVEEEALKLLNTGRFCLFLGGDHSVTIPLHRAFGRYQKKLAEQQGKERKVGVIHFDAHCDLCDIYDGHKWSHACTERRSLEAGVMRPQDLMFLGIRSWEADELEFLAENPEIIVLKAYDVFKIGYLEAYRKIEQRFKDYNAVYFTLDIDVLDPAFAPGTGTPEAGGISNRELMELVKLMLGNLPIKTMDIVEVSPALDISDITSWAALKVIYEVYGCLNR